jgi:hypothetical protein
MICVRTVGVRIYIGTLGLEGAAGCDTSATQVLDTVPRTTDTYFCSNTTYQPTVATSYRERELSSEGRESK